MQTKREKPLILGLMYYGGNKPGDLVDPTHFLRSVQAEGASLLLQYPGAPSDPRALADFFDAVVLSGSWSDIDPSLLGEERHEKTFAFDKAADLYAVEALQRFREAGKPILGVCYGMQIINVAFGGSLDQHIPEDGRHLAHDARGAFHNTEVLENTLLSRVIGEGWHLTNTSHHQAVRRPAEGFKISAYAEDGVPEAVEGENVLGLQWHPERMKRAWNCGLFETFARAASLGSWEAALAEKGC